MRQLQSGVTFFFLGASALPSRTAWCLRTPLALKVMSSLTPPSSVGVQFMVRLNELWGCKHKTQKTGMHHANTKPQWNDVVNLERTSFFIRITQHLKVCVLSWLNSYLINVSTYVDRERVFVHREAFIRGDLFDGDLRFDVPYGVLKMQNCRFRVAQLHTAKSHKRWLRKLNQSQNRKIVLLVTVHSPHRTDVQKPPLYWSQRFSHFQHDKNVLLKTNYMLQF